jgi:pimeloyl-ACP methyl ester carboxylesterase
VYLHGYVDNPDFVGHASALDIQDLLDADYRVCVYDRANVGLSDPVDGPLDGESSVDDLHSLLKAAGVDPPYVLLAASFGGLIAHIYAATYPKEVVGMVYLDASLPADHAKIDERFFPGEKVLGDWRDPGERIDQYAAYAQAYALEGDAPDIPLTFLASSDLPPEPQIARAVRAGQRRYTAMFSPGRFIVLDVPHYMEPVIPDRIADEVRRVIASAEGK